MRRFVNTGPEGAHVPPGELCSGPTLNTSDWSNQLLLRLQYFTDDLMLVLFPPSSPQVRISVQPSRCHSDTIRLEVVSNRPHQAPETQAQTPQPQGARGRSQLVQEVVRQAEEASQQAEEKRGRAPKLSKEEREFRQSKCPNLYSLLEEVRELALLDLAACGAGGGLGAAAQACATSA